jgi:hypothetical protein
MKKLSTYAFVIVICLGTTALLATSGRTIRPSEGSEAQFAVDGAFRDGLYLGRLAAERGELMRPSVGRWSTAQNRSMFSVGYRRGYDESARAGANAEPAESAE